MPHVLGILTDQVNEYLSHRYRLANTKISKIGDGSENAVCGRHRATPQILTIFQATREFLR